VVSCWFTLTKRDIEINDDLTRHISNIFTLSFIFLKFLYFTKTLQSVRRMAPSATSATSWMSSDEGRNGAAAEALAEPNVEMAGGNAPEVKLYKDIYSKAFTDGYISGYSQPQLAKQIPIAITGMSCRLPGNVTTPDEFWELLSRARTGWSEIPKERFDAASFYHPNPGKGGCFNATGGNFLKEDLGLFDAPFFSLTAQEAISMDPQQRILLECTFEALESAGITKHEIVGQDVGVFMGGSFSEYESQSFVDTESIPMYQSTGMFCLKEKFLTC
jgi:hypothetical protein